MWPASMIVGPPLPFTSARLFPATSPVTFANCFACSRHTFAGADSKPDGPGVSSSFLRKPSDSEEIIRERVDSEGPHIAFSQRCPQHANDSCSLIAARRLPESQLP